MYEAVRFEEIENPVMRTEGYNPPWTKHKEPVYIHRNCYFAGAQVYEKEKDALTSYYRTVGHA